jgi:hypothetical protein
MFLDRLIVINRELHMSPSNLVVTIIAKKNMSKIKLIILVTTSCLLLRTAFSQQTLPHTTFESVQLHEKYSDLFQYDLFSLYELQDGSFLLVTRYGNTNAGSYHFNSEGKFLKGNSNLLKTLKGQTFNETFIFGNRVIMLTSLIKDGQRIYTFWDITQADLPVKLSEVKSNEGGYYKLTQSPDQKKILFVEDGNGEAVIFNSTFEKEFETELFPASDHVKGQYNYLDAIAMDNNGNIALAIYLNRASSWLKQPVGSWILVGLEQGSSTPQVWNLAELCETTTYEWRNPKTITCLRNEKFIFTHNTSEKTRLIYLDCISGKIEENLVYDHQSLIPSNSPGSIDCILSVQPINESNIVALYSLRYPDIPSTNTSKPINGSTGTFLINLKSNEVISTHNMLPPCNNRVYYQKHLDMSDSNNNFTTVVGFANPSFMDHVKNHIPFNKDQLVQERKTDQETYLPYLAILDHKSEDITYFKCHKNPKVKFEKSLIFLSESGAPVVVEYDGKTTLTLHVHK